MKNIVNKLVLGVLITLGALLSGQMLPPPPPPQEETGGGPGTKEDVPVDMYVIFLAIIAVMFIVYFVRQYNNKKVA